MPDPDAPDEGAVRKPFAQFVKEVRRGGLHDELTDALADVIAGVVKHGKDGKLTLSFTIKSEDDETISVSEKYRADVPTPPARATTFFANDQGEVSRNRLNQPELPLQGIDGGKSNRTSTAAEEAADA